MTKKHFEFIAETIAALPDHAPSLRAQKESTARAFAEALSKAYPRFDSRQFLTACRLRPVEA